MIMIRRIGWCLWMMVCTTLCVCAQEDTVRIARDSLKLLQGKALENPSSLVIAKEVSRIISIVTLSLRAMITFPFFTSTIITLVILQDNHTAVKKRGAASIYAAAPCVTFSLFILSP